MVVARLVAVAIMPASFTRHIATHDLLAA